MVVIALVIQLTLGLLVFLYQSLALNDLFADRLRERSEPLALAIERGDGAAVAQKFEEVAASTLTFPPDEPRYAALYDDSGVRVAAAGTLEIQDAVVPRALAGATRDGFMFRHAAGGDPAPPSPYRVIARRLGDRDGKAHTLIVARPDRIFETMLEQIRRVLALSLPVGVIGAGVAGWLISGLAIAPVRRIRELADALSPDTIEESHQAPVEVGIAELQDVQNALEEIRDRIRRAFIVRDRFIANVSHELKTPIAVILTEAQTLDVSKLDRDARLFVRSVIDETRRLSRTIESFLTLTKIRAGKSLMEHAPCEVSDFVMDAVLNCSRTARQKGVSLNPVLSEGEHARSITGDCELLRVMVDSLLRNAIACSPNDSQVEIKVSESVAECAIAVRDAGPGIDARVDFDLGNHNHEERVLDRDNIVGLGVSIAQTIADLHAGTLSARNLAGGGAEYVVRLPCNPITHTTVLVPGPGEAISP
jgi:signal transduction histidine kinase